MLFRLDSMLLKFNCQLDITLNHLRKDSQMRNCLGQVGLWECLGRTDVKRPRPSWVASFPELVPGL